jgi:hypothetical protein
MLLLGYSQSSVLQLCMLAKHQGINFQFVGNSTKTTRALLSATYHYYRPNVKKVLRTNLFYKDNFKNLLKLPNQNQE